jgi:hypothetical protein
MNEDTLDANYDAVEEWCNNVVNHGHDLLFNAEIFDAEMKSASKKFQFPIEVCTCSACTIDTMFVCYMLSLSGIIIDYQRKRFTDIIICSSIFSTNMQSYHSLLTLSFATYTSNGSRNKHLPSKTI